MSLATLLKQHKAEKSQKIAVVNPGMSAAAVLVLMRAAEQEDNTESQIDTALECVAMNNELLAACETDADKKAVTKLMNTMIVGQTGTSLESAEAYFAANDVDAVSMEALSVGALRNIVKLKQALGLGKTAGGAKKWWGSLVTRIGKAFSAKWASYANFVVKPFGKANLTLQKAIRDKANKIAGGSYAKIDAAKKASLSNAEVAAIKAAESGKIVDIKNWLIAGKDATLSKNIIAGAVTAAGVGASVGAVAVALVTRTAGFLSTDDFKAAFAGLVESTKAMDGVAGIKASGSDADARLDSVKQKLGSIFSKLENYGMSYDAESGKFSSSVSGLKLAPSGTTPIEAGWDGALVEKASGDMNKFFEKYDGTYLENVMGKGAKSVEDYADEPAAKLQLKAVEALVAHVGALGGLCDKTISKLGVVKEGEEA